MATKEGGLVARSVREALGTLMSPQLYSQLVARALSSAHLSEIPEQGRAVAQWIQGPLLREVEVAAGADAAELVAEQLAPVVAHASNEGRPSMPREEPRPGSDRAAKRKSSDRAAMRSAPYVRVASDRVRPPSAEKNARVPSEPAQRPAKNPFGSDIPTGLVSAPPRRQSAETTRTQLTAEQLAAMNQAGHTARPAAPDPEDRELRRVLLASNARGSVDSLQGYLQGVARVAPVADLVGLLDALDDKTLRDPIVLVDCQRPTVHATSIAAIGEDLPAGTTIVLWGVSDDTWSQLDRDRVPSCHWVRCSHEATPGDVGALVSMLISQR
ncbi:MAG TPA: hypothetical protein VFX59_05200 [Polyangiales bacterium]|nr:hypothetical protein [Polyangiales bacterium]